jgi:hypothetical protein
MSDPTADEVSGKSQERRPTGRIVPIYGPQQPEEAFLYQIIVKARGRVTVAGCQATHQGLAEFDQCRPRRRVSRARVRSRQGIGTLTFAGLRARPVQPDRTGEGATTTRAAIAGHHAIETLTGWR